MAKYSLGINRSAQKELDALDDKLFTRIDQKIQSLANEPPPEGCKKLKGFKDQLRIRIGDYRAVYTLDDSSQTVTVTRVAPRGGVYE